MPSPLTQPGVLAAYVDNLWEDEILGVLASYVAIRCISPDFDPAWADNGEILRAAEVLAAGPRHAPCQAVLSRSYRATA